MKSSLYLLLSLSLMVIVSCSKPQTEANTTIDAKLRQSINAKNDSIVTAMISSDLKIWKALGSDNFVKHLQASTRNVVWAFRERYVKDTYKVYDEYKVVQPSAGEKTDIVSEQNGYTFTFVNEEKESYVSLLKLPFIHQDYLLIILYHNINGEWKLTELGITPIGRYGKTPHDFYTMAQNAEKNGFLIDAYFYNNLAQEWLGSIDKESHIVFNNEKKIKLYMQTVSTKLSEKYPFPYVLADVASKPQITEITAKAADDALYPVVRYDTKLPLDDAAAIKTEYDAVRAAVRKHYKDLDYNSHTVLYAVSKVVPDPAGGTYRKTLDFTDNKK